MMPNDKRTTEQYRNHQLLAAFHQGSFKGRVWNSDKKLLTEISGTSIEQLLSALKEFVDKVFINIAESRISMPEQNEYVRAFQKFVSTLPDGYVSMLKGHYHAPNRTITARKLAEAAGYSNWSSANLHYGLLGKMLYEELPIKLPSREDGSLIYTYALATEGDSNGDESEWQWVLRPGVVGAIEQLGLHN